MISSHSFSALQIWATRTGYTRYTQSFLCLNCRRLAPWAEFPPCLPSSTLKDRVGYSSTGSVYCEARVFRVFAISHLRRRSSRSRFALIGGGIAAVSTRTAEGIPPDSLVGTPPLTAWHCACTGLRQAFGIRFSKCRCAWQRRELYTSE